MDAEEIEQQQQPEQPEQSAADSEACAVAQRESCTEQKETIEGSKIGGQEPLIQKLQQLSVTSGTRSRAMTPPTARSSTPSSVGSPDSLQISPATLNEIRGESLRHMDYSPSTSQVSVGSIGPTLTAALLPTRHYDLTPVTRNTSGNYVYVDGSHSNHAIVSPDDSGYLHGEHLALPADLSAPDSTRGPAIPPLRTAERAQSVGTLDAGVLRQLQNSDEPFLPAPVQFPSRKFYSFTSRQQYEEAMLHDGSDDDTYNDRYKANGLKPYQPDRSDELGVGSIPEEELSRIFIPRRTESDGGESHENHRLRNPIPLQSEWSIPSIHLAHHLTGGSTSASYTDNTEEEDSLCIRDDDASLSSRASSLYLPDDSDGPSETLVLPFGTGLSFQPTTGVVDDMPFVQMPERLQYDDSILAMHGDARRKRKQRKAQQAYEWLQSVEADDQVVAEAASSKFLTRNATTAFRSIEGRRLSNPNESVAAAVVPNLHRQASSPSTLALEE